MDISKMKNMVVLKNLPSNIVDEAYVVLKSSKKAKRLEKIEKNKNVNNIQKKKDKEYVLKEEEMVVSDYITKIEKRELVKKENKKNKFKFYFYISSFIAILEGVFIFCN